jgi:hypothetical protein
LTTQAGRATVGRRPAGTPTPALSNITSGRARGGRTRRTWRAQHIQPTGSLRRFRRAASPDTYRDSLLDNRLHARQDIPGLANGQTAYHPVEYHHGARSDPTTTQPSRQARPQPPSGSSRPNHQHPAARRPVSSTTGGLAGEDRSLVDPHPLDGTRRIVVLGIHSRWDHGDAIAETERQLRVAVAIASGKGGHDVRQCTT